MAEESKHPNNLQALAATPEGPVYAMAYKGGMKGGIIGGVIGAIMTMIVCFICHYMLG